MEIIGTAPTVEFDYGFMWLVVLIAASVAYCFHFIIEATYERVKHGKVTVNSYLDPVLTVVIAGVLALLISGITLTNIRGNENEELKVAAIESCGFEYIDFPMSNGGKYWTAIRDNTIVNGQSKYVENEKVHLISTQWGCDK